jgi:hypothetical protein
VKSRWRWEAHHSSSIVSTRACCVLLTVQLLSTEEGESLAKFTARCGLKVPRKVDDRFDPDLRVWEPLSNRLTRFQNDKEKFIYRIAHVSDKERTLNPIPDSRIRPRFTAGGDGVWVGNLFYTGFQDDLRSFYILSILLILSCLSFTSGLSFFHLLKLSGLGRVSMV